MRKINKKGSHVGVVVSFVVFITFLAFLYSVLQPTITKEKDKQYILDYLTLNLIENATANMSTLMINVSESTENQDCINMQKFPEIPESEKDSLLIKNASDYIFPYNARANGDVWIETGKEFSGILKVYYGDELTKSPQSDATGCNPKPYTVGYVLTFDEIFETKMYELNATYYADYEGLKIYLGVPEGTEFSFYVLDTDRNIILSAEMYEPPTDTGVFVQETPIKYLNENGESQFGFLIVKVW